LIGAEIARDKDETSRLLELAAVPTPAWRVVSTPEAAIEAAHRVGMPVVIKPIDGNHGRGVTLDIAEDDAVADAFLQAAAASRRRQVVVQRQAVGQDHRILVIGGRMVACAERLPAAVHGDGRRTVAALVSLANEDPRRGVGHARALTRIALDQTTQAVLRAQDLTEDDIPSEGRRVTLSRAANLSTGGTSVDRTEEVHPEVAAMAELAAKVVGLDVAGIDVITTDIARPLRETGGAVIEINSGPGFRMHTHPAVGRSRNVGGAVLDQLFGAGTKGRIPVAAVTGSNGKTTTVRLLAHLLATSGLAVGYTTTEDIVADGLVLRTGDMAGPSSARLLLSTPTIEAAVLEVARGGILRDGLGYDYNDVAVVTNVTGDHLGLDGIETMDQLAEVKAVIVDAVPRSGTAVLNADDPLVRAMADRCSGAIALTSMGDSADGVGAARVERHLAGGGLGGGLVWRDGVEWLVICRGAHVVVDTPVGAIPLTLGGAARMHVANAMAAACAAVALGVDGDVIARALGSFAASPGRVEHRIIQGRETILDYGHNIAALRALKHMIERIAHGRRVVGVVSMPGDRRDADRIAYGALAGTIFDTLVVAEPAMRGRPVGEAARLLMEAASRTEDGRSSRAGTPTFVADEADAACAALCASEADDLLVLCVANAPRVLARLATCPVGASS
ncbi:MAG: cyanophycin synthetase, partial [Chloroflexi bacterium]|nr:cyanophycin synthetase [Chloroflexota bacterium]